jgi:hypothetical protein
MLPMQKNKFPLFISLSWLIGVSMMVLILVAGCSGGSGDDQPVSSDQDSSPPMSGSSAQVVGRVTDQDGNPLAEVGIAVKEGSSAVPEILVLSGEDGKYVWDLPVGTYKMAANKEGFIEQVKEVVVKEDQQAELDFQLEKAP